MPYQRYLRVEGVLDKNGAAILVTNPHVPPLRTGDLARFAGMAEKPADRKDADPDGLHSHFEPRAEIVVDHPDLRRAIAHGDLKLHAECASKSQSDAAAKLTAPTSAPKGGSK